jgi:prevent-host-death family protein
MGMTQTISASEFKAKCLSLLDRLARHELDRVIITKRGKPVAVVEPPRRQADEVRNIHGFMRGSVIIADDADLTAPVLDERSTAENGELHG